MEYFHLNYRSADFFVGRLQTRLRESTSSALRNRFARWNPDIHGEPALAVVAKIEMLNRILEPVPFAHSTIIYRANKPTAEQFWQHAVAGFWQKVLL